MLTAKEAHEQSVYNSYDTLMTYCEGRILGATSFGNFSVRVDAEGFESTEVVERVWKELREAGFNVVEDPGCGYGDVFEIQW